MVASYTSSHTYIFDIEAGKQVLKLDTKQNSGKERGGKKGQDNSLDYWWVNDDQILICKMKRTFVLYLFMSRHVKKNLVVMLFCCTYYNLLIHFKEIDKPSKKPKKKNLAFN